MFLGVWVVICIAQGLIVTFGGKVFKVHNSGLTLLQWGWCVAVGCTSLIWNLFLKCLPDTLCPVFGNESEEIVQEAE